MVYMRYALLMLILLIAPSCNIGFRAKGNGKNVGILANICYEGLKAENVSVVKNEDGTIDIKLTWAALSGANYKVYGDSIFEQIIAETESTEWIKKNVTAGETYVFTLRAFNSSCVDENKSIVFFKVPLDRPVFAGLRKAATVSNTKLWLKWDKATSDNIRGYNIYYPKDLKNPIAFSTDTFSVISGASPALEYCFIVRAQDKWRIEDENREIKCATTLSYDVPNFAGLVKVEQMTGSASLSKLRLVWDKAGGDVTGYRIYMSKVSEGQDFAVPIAADLANNTLPLVGSYIAEDKTSAVVSGLEKDTTYYFVVRAFYLKGTEIRTEFSYIEKSQKTLLTIPPVVNPEIISIRPKAGGINGGTSVTITGKNFQELGIVKLGGVNCTNVNLKSSSKLTCVTGPHLPQFVDLEIFNPDAGYVKTTDKPYEYTTRPSPSVTAITKNKGPQSGGKLVTVTGSNFVSTPPKKPLVFIGEKECTDVIYVSAIQLKCTTPSNDLGSHDVFVENPDGQIGSLSNGYTYTEAPKITNINPASGPKAGGTTVAIKGTGFAAGAKVFFGSAECTNPIQSVDSVEPPILKITCQSPPVTLNGPVNVRVENQDEQADTVVSGFTYVPPPSLTSIFPIAGSTSGGTKVTLSGGGFIAPAKVFIGGSECTGVTISGNDSVINCTTGVHLTAETVNVYVENSGGQVSNELVGAYTYRNVPAISSISPNPGTTLGGIPISISGENFVNSNDLLIQIGGNPCPVSAFSANEITCTLPPANSPGSVTVFLRNGDLQELTVANGFTYQSGPSITRVKPNKGPVTAGYPVKIIGTNFLPGATVEFGSSACANPVVNALGTEISCNAPGGQLDTSVSVTVKNNPGPQSPSLPNAYTYQDGPKVIGIYPTYGATPGQYTISILGSNIDAPPANSELGAVVTVGGLPCDNATNPLPNNKFTCRTGVLTSGEHDLVIRNADNQSTTIVKGFRIGLPDYMKPTAVSTLLTGTLGSKGTSDGFYNNSRFNSPNGIAGDSQFLYVADTGNNTIRIINRGSGEVNVLAGNSSLSGCMTSPTADVAFADLVFKTPKTPVLVGNNLYVTVTDCHQVYKLNLLTRTATLFAGGTGASNWGFTPGIPGTNALLYFPDGMTSDGTNLYFTERTATVRRINILTSEVSGVIAGVLNNEGHDDSNVNYPLGRLHSPGPLAYASGSLYLTSFYGQTVRKFILTGSILSTVIGGEYGCAGGNGLNARLGNPTGITISGSKMYLGSYGLPDIKIVDLSSSALPVSQYAGNCFVGHQDGNVGATPAPTFGSVTGFFVDGNALFAADYQNSTIRLISKSGPTTIVSTPFGISSSYDSYVEGNSATSRYGSITQSVALKSFYYVVDQIHSVIRKIDKVSGTSFPFSGMADSPGFAIGANNFSKYYLPEGIATDGKNLFVTDFINHIIRKIDIANDSTSVLAGVPSQLGLVNDSNGTQAKFWNPRGIVSDGAFLYVADYNNDVIRKITIATGEVKTLAGSGASCTNDDEINNRCDGRADTAKFYRPHYITTDGTYLYVSDFRGAIRRVQITDGRVDRLVGGVRGESTLVTDGVTLFAAESGGAVIRAINLSSKVVTVFLGREGVLDGIEKDGPIADARNYGPTFVDIADGAMLFGRIGIHVLR